MHTSQWTFPCRQPKQEKTMAVMVCPIQGQQYAADTMQAGGADFGFMNILEQEDHKIGMN